MPTPREIVGSLTLAEKAALCSGKNFWHLKGIPDIGLPGSMVTDGPHGLRKQAGGGDNLGLGQSVPATCFPAACATAASFSPALLHDIGSAMGEECLQEQVSVILGPGTNIKRSPLCGRNFEYFSEDPCLSGQLAAALIEGVQQHGVGTSLKHFAANNQEAYRMVNNSVVDMRALREVYLTAFEAAVTKAQPWTVMCSYNRVNGTYASDNEWLLHEVLREQWGFKGLVVSDWGAVNDRVAGIRAGMDIEMPGPDEFNDAKIVEAVQNGALEEALLDRTAIRIVELLQKSHDGLRPGYQYDGAAHHALARHAAAQSAVLLQNSGNALPIAPGRSIGVIGKFARLPRYQGSGSSKIHPLAVDDAVEELQALGANVRYADGYSLEDMATQQALVEEAVALAAECDVAVVLAGLPDQYESEGFDRENLHMPDSHNELIRRVAAANSNTIVVLQCGAPVLLPWAAQVKAILLMYLGGEAVNGAVADLLLGNALPAGRLPESWPLAAEDVPCHEYFPGTPESVEYRESIFVGYRYYTSAARPVAYPFGFGLCYTTFALENLQLSDTALGNGDCVTATATLRNTGEAAGHAVVQLYVGKTGKSRLPRPVRELKDFGKYLLQPGEETQINFTLTPRAFAYYNVAANAWAIEGGEYQVSLGFSAQDIAVTATLAQAGDGLETRLPDYPATAPGYYSLPATGQLTIREADFEALYGGKLPPHQRRKGRPYDENSTLRDLEDIWLGKLAKRAIGMGISKMAKGDRDMQRLMQAMVMDLPLRAATMMTNGAFTTVQLEGLLDMANGKEGRGLLRLAKLKKR